MDKPHAWFQVEHWYHVFVVLGAAGAAAALMFDLRAIENGHSFLLFTGLFFVGIGEWIIHPLQMKVVGPIENPYGTITGHPRNPKLIGTLFDVLGAVLLLAAFYQIIQAL